ncbi:hypothetical protein [Kitasatospora purpeofusca]|uniref:hypothetical protein n=1 Tax=Kitasatospora purpeofusca TaxID=67352 RepID=UPI003664E80A
MLRTLEAAGDDLFTDTYHQRLVAFVQDLHSRDPKGDQGRYPTTKGGTPSLAAVCCADPERLCEYVNALFFYTRDRVGPTA